MNLTDSILVFFHRYGDIFLSGFILAMIIM